MKFARIVVAVAIATSCYCLGQTPRDIAHASFKSVVLLEMTDTNGQPLSLGSGFFVSQDIIATNAHVIKGASGGTANLVGTSLKMPLLGLVAIDTRSDLALLKVAGAAPPVRLGSSDASPVVGDHVYVVGNPLGLEGTFSEGIISGLRSIGSDSILQMTAPISPGSSGGPVMDVSGVVIGVAEATFANGQNLNLAVPVTYLSKLLVTSSSTPTQVTPLGQGVVQPKSQDRKTLADEVGQRVESAVTVSNFEFIAEISPFESAYGYNFRLTNRLPVPIHNIWVRIIYYDSAKSVMDFEDFYFAPPIPPGLSKTVERMDTREAKLAGSYYHTHSNSGAKGLCERLCMSPIVETRVIGFSAEDNQ